jgi:hypothetical protein
MGKWEVERGVFLLAAVLMMGPLGAQESHVQGYVLDVATDEPVQATLVALLEGESGETVAATATTDVAGRFYLAAGGPGTFRLRAEHLGYRTVTTPPFDLVDGEPALEVEVLLGAQAIPLAPLVIVSERPARMDLRLHARGFLERRRQWGRAEGSGFGHFLDRSDIERRNAFRVTDLLGDIPGVRPESRGGRRPPEITLRSTTSMLDAGLRCSPLIFVDGVPAAMGAPERHVPGGNPGVHIDELVSVANVVGVEVYPGLTQPGEFQRGNLCGVIVLWTGE